MLAESFSPDVSIVCSNLLSPRRPPALWPTPPAPADRDRPWRPTPTGSDRRAACCCATPAPLSAPVGGERGQPRLIACCVPVGLGLATPQPELHAVVGSHLVGNEPHEHDAAGEFAIVPRGRSIQASSCQRTRSDHRRRVQAGRPDARSLGSFPVFGSSTTTNLVHTRPSAASAPASWSASCLAMNTTASTGRPDRRGRGRAVARVPDRWYSWDDRRPPRPTGRERGHRDAPEPAEHVDRRECRQVAEPTQSEAAEQLDAISSASALPSVSCSQPIGRSAQNAGDAPGSTMTASPRRLPPAVPQHSNVKSTVGDTDAGTGRWVPAASIASASRSDKRSASERSPPKYLEGPRASRLIQPGSTTSRRGDSSATGADDRLELAGVDGRRRRHQRQARATSLCLRRRWPITTPSAAAAAVRATTR